MSTWTAKLLERGPVLERYGVEDEDGRSLAALKVPATPDGRSTVAKMVAALQMEEALVAAAAVFETHGLDNSEAGTLLLAALEAAKRLQP